MHACVMCASTVQARAAHKSLPELLPVRCNIRIYRLPVCQRGDDQPAAGPQVLIRVQCFRIDHAHNNRLLQAQHKRAQGGHTSSAKRMLAVVAIAPLKCVAVDDESRGGAAPEA